MRLIRLAVILTVSLMLAPLAAPAQQPPGKAARIGFLGDVPSFLDEAFRQGLHELGYVEGQNIAIEHRAAEWKYERLPGLAAELVRLNVDVIVAASPPATEAAKQATRTIPIVFTVSGDPVAEGFVASLARPGGNLTGLATIPRSWWESSSRCSKRSPRRSPGWLFTRTPTNQATPARCDRRRTPRGPSGCNFKS